MAKKQGKQNHKRLVVSYRYVATPDGNARLSRAIDILLRAATRDSTKSGDSKKGPVGDSLINSGEDDPE